MIPILQITIYCSHTFSKNFVSLKFFLVAGGPLEVGAAVHCVACSCATDKHYSCLCAGDCRL